MAYISSNNNRFYVALESSYGSAAAITANSRIPAVKLTAKNTPEKVQRRDKTGSRTYVGLPMSVRRNTTFQLQTYMTAWSDQSQSPVHGALVQAAMGGAVFTGTTAAVATSDGSSVTFSGSHGLSVGQAITSGGEIRFVAAIANSSTVVVNAPFSIAPAAGSQVGPTVTYSPGSTLGSVSVYDYWSPTTAVQRMLTGASVDHMQLKLNGDIHQFSFSGQAADIVDTSSFQNGEAALTAFPVEPTVAPLNYSIVPGHLGQMWVNNTPDRFYTITGADLTFSNNLDLRNNEFGSRLATGIVPGQRSVMLDFSLYQQDDTATQSLYQAARQGSPISAMMQLGEQSGQLVGVYIPSLVLQVPAFDDSEAQQQWQFQNCRAQGSSDDEIFIAFA